jgi:hypothetical protein
MASGHVNRVNRPNTWLHRPMLQTFKKVLANSEPSTHGGKADIAWSYCPMALWSKSGHGRPRGNRSSWTTVQYPTMARI